ncbi:MAG: hypothetical protein COA79_15850 [Planctomycetota bacterium]|nr:MAG: hypothetical protein COA79_15850 [Planctomycetota bacterium]
MSVRLIQFSDIHVGSPYSFRYQPAWSENFFNAMEQVKEFDVQPEVIVITGDLTRDGETHPFELRQIKEILEKYPYQFYCIPGNHDSGGRYDISSHARVSSTKIERFRKVFGDDKFQASVGNCRIIGFNSFILGSGLPEEPELWAWLEEKAKEKNDQWSRQIWFMHNLAYNKHPFENEIITKEENRKLWYHLLELKAQHRLMQLISNNDIDIIANGHTHNYIDRTVDGIHHVTCPSTAFHPALPATSPLGYMIYDIDDDGIKVELKQLSNISEKPGYGIGGNILYDERDYSLAQKVSPETTIEIKAQLS